MIVSSHATDSIKEAFPHIIQSDIYDGLRVVNAVTRMIIGRVCGSTADKLSAYFAIINYFRETGNQQCDSLEIGTLFGGSCLIKLLAMKSLGIDGKIVCIDPMSGYYGDPLDPISGIPVSIDLFWTNIRNFGFGPDDVRLFPQKSSESSIFKTIANYKFATVLIDGDHSLDAITHDWDSYSQLIAEKGIILIDDYAESSWPDITSFIDSRFGEASESGWLKYGPLGSTIILRKDDAAKSIDRPSSDVREAFSLPLEFVFSTDSNTITLKIADIYLQQGKTEQSKDMYLSIDNHSNLFANEHKFIASLGLARLQLKVSSEAVITLKRNINLMEIPSQIRTLKTIKNYGELLFNIEEYEAAKALYVDSLLLLQLTNPDKFLLLQGLGQIEMRQGNMQKAADYFKASLMLPAISAVGIGNAVNTLCSCYLKLKLYDMAADCLRKYLKKLTSIPKNLRGSMLLNLGYIKLQQKEYESAVKYYKSTICLLKSLDSPRAHALIGLGYSLLALDSYTEAIQYFEEALSIKNATGFDKKKAIHALSQCYHFLGITDCACPFGKHA